MEREFYVLIEKDENGFFVGEVPSLKTKGLKKASFELVRQKGSSD